VYWYPSADIGPVVFDNPPKPHDDHDA